MIKGNCSKCGKEMLFYFKKDKDEMEKLEVLLCDDCNNNSIFFVCEKCGRKFFLLNQRKQKICRICATLNFSQSEDYRQKQKNKSKHRWESMTQEEYLLECEKRKTGWTDEKKQIQSKKQIERWDRMSDEDMNSWKEFVVNRYKNKSEQEKKEWSEKYSGSNNPMYGKSVYDVWVEKYGKEEADRRFEIQKNKTKNTINSFSKEKKDAINAKKGLKGNKNGMYGKSVYDVWVEKYGKEEADRRKYDMGKKISERNKGKNNPMYGKVPSNGAGAGISGWYKNWYFRSLRELSFMINVIEKEGHEWKNAESHEFTIKYLDVNGVERTYHPDFVLDDKIIIEIKPEKLQLNENNQRKQDGAILWCATNDFEYRMVDVDIIEPDILYDMYISGVIKFNEKSLKRFLNSRQIKKFLRSKS